MRKIKETKKRFSVNLVFNSVILLGFIFFTIGCIRSPFPPSTGIEDADSLFSAAKDSQAADFAPFHFNKAREYLRKARVAARKIEERKSGKVSFFAASSVYESRLAIAITKEKMDMERLKTAEKRMKNAKALLDEEKNEIHKIKERLLREFSSLEL